MSNSASQVAETSVRPSPDWSVMRRADALADRLLQGASALATFANGLSDAEWQTRLPKDGRTIGVVVHHVASVYPIEIALARSVADGKPVTGVTAHHIDEMNAAHARDNHGVTRDATLALLRLNSAYAAAEIRAMSDDELDRAAPVSLYAHAPMTCQFVLEDHAVRHSFHHLARIVAALNR